MNNVDELVRRTKYLSKPLNASLSLANRLPVWMPRFLRLMPLRAVTCVYRVHLSLLRS